MAWTDLKAAVAAVIRTNGNQEITGGLLQSTLNSIIDQVGANASYRGVAIPSTNPGTPDGPVFYIASTQGTYANFGGFVLDGGFAVLSNVSGSWTGTKFLKIEMDAKADHGYESNPKTLKEVDDSISQSVGKIDRRNRFPVTVFDNHVDIKRVLNYTLIQNDRVLDPLSGKGILGDGDIIEYIVTPGDVLRIKTRYTGTGSPVFALFQDSDTVLDIGGHVQNMQTDGYFYVKIPDNATILWVLYTSEISSPMVEVLGDRMVKDIIDELKNNNVDLINVLDWGMLYYRNTDHALLASTISLTTYPIRLSDIEITFLSLETIQTAISICFWDDEMNFVHGLDATTGPYIELSHWNNALALHPETKYITFTINPNVYNSLFGVFKNADLKNLSRPSNGLYRKGNLSDLPLINEYVNKTNNQFTSHELLKRTDFLDLDLYNFTYINIESNYSVWVLSFWDKNKNFISGKGVDVQRDRLSLPVNGMRPDNAKYVIFSILPTNYNNIEFVVRNFALISDIPYDIDIAQTAALFKAQDRKYRNCLGEINLSNYSEMDASKKGDFFICTEKGNSHYIHDCEVGYGEALLYNGEYYKRGVMIPTSDLIVSNNPVPEYDVCILGGGGGGVGAAYSLINKGLKVCIVERAPLLGGTHTAGMVVDFCATPVGEWFKEKIFTPMNQAGGMNIQRFEGPILPPTEENYNLTNICYYDPATGNHHDPGMIMFDRIAVSNHYYDDFIAAGFDIKLNRKFIKHTISNEFADVKPTISNGIYRVTGDMTVTTSWENTGFIQVEGGDIIRVRTKGDGNDGNDLVIYYGDILGTGGISLQSTYNGVIDYEEYEIQNDGYVVVNNKTTASDPIQLELGIYDDERVACEEILIENMINGVQEKISAKFFIDCSGDGYLVRSLCPVEDEDFYIGTDPKNRFNESLYLDLATPGRYSLNALENSFRIEPDLTDREDLTDINPISGVGAATNYTMIDRTNPLFKIISPSTGQNISIAKFVDEGYDAAMKDGLNKLPYCWKLTKEDRNLQDYRFAHPGEILSIREGYRMACDSTITQDDIVQRVTSETDIVSKRFVALSTWYLDFHGGAGVGIDPVGAKSLPVDCFGIPIDALFPKKLRNVMIACRGLGVSHIASAATRITKTMMSIGFASGLAAEQFVKDELVDMRDVDIQKIQTDIKLPELIAVMETLYPLNPYL